jgi:SpoVK/Ycf46/Vps4 family AAA+-type ATPase
MPKENKITYAKKLNTQLKWADLILSPAILEEIGLVKTWIEKRDQLLEIETLTKRVKPGFTGLFSGASGTGKTMTVSLIGKETGSKVYRIDLLQVLSKYIGETEKNLSRLFDTAEQKGWILFFDEADALFGKRTNVKDAHDRYASQKVSYLLQKVEEFSGLAIFSFSEDSIDDAFLNRMQFVIEFQRPGTEERLKLWKQLFSGKMKLEASCNLEMIAQKYELTAKAMNNVFQNCTLKALQRKSNQILCVDVFHAIKKEFRKEGRSA